uniref:Uncharacterized protein n=1 Tax=Acaryochloris sp. HICR111A TaxID=576912 RepID=I6UE38_9CYAN|nr:hypothetical protein [Acaryochloris sp. HICR111A]
MNAAPTSSPPDPRQDRYLELIDRLLACPNGEEPEILNTSPDLLDAGLVQALMQTATYFAHHDNPDAAKFLIFIARELTQQLGLYPQDQPSA